MGAEVIKLIDQVEEHRLKILRQLNIMDTPPEIAYDDLAKLAKDICDTPIAFIGLIDECRQWFKAKEGTDVNGSPREVAFCAYTILQDHPLIVSDATKDDRFKANPVVTGYPKLRFYAGVPLIINKARVGTLCVLDVKPRELGEKQISALKTIAKQVASTMEAGYMQKQWRETEKLLIQHEVQIAATSKMSALGEMASGIAHEINNPLTVIMSRAGQLIDLAERGKLDAAKILETSAVIEKTCARVAKTVRSLRAFSRNDDYEPLETVTVSDIFADTLNLCREKFRNGVLLEVKDESHGAMIFCHPVQVSQILLNLLSNAYDAVQESKEKWVHLECKVLGSEIEIAVSDSGPGVAPELREKVMEPFFTTKALGKGTGLGLSISQRIAHAHCSEIKFDEQSSASRIYFRLAKVES